jgi:hypothetical protein
MNCATELFKTIRQVLRDPQLPSDRNNSNFCPYETVIAAFDSERTASFATTAAVAATATAAAITATAATTATAAAKTKKNAASAAAAAASNSSSRSH